MLPNYDLTHNSLGSIPFTPQSQYRQTPEEREQQVSWSRRRGGEVELEKGTAGQKVPTLTLKHTFISALLEKRIGENDVR